MPHVEHIRRQLNLDVDITTGNELLDIAVPRGFRGTLREMFGEVMMTQSPTSTITAKFAIIPRRSDNLTLGAWVGMMNADPVWIGLLGIAMNGAGSERLGVQNKMSFAHKWVSDVSIMGSAPNNAPRGWLLVADSVASMTIQGGMVLFLDLEWLGGAGDPRELPIEFQDEEEDDV